MSSAADWRLAVDIGGTFTDVVLLDAASGRVVVDKTLTTPAAPLDGVRAGVRELLDKAGVRPADITAPIVHATTLITNALIEGKIGRAGIVTTAGFGDTLLIRNEHRYDMYDLQIEFPEPPVPRERVVELVERTSPHGVVGATRHRPKASTPSRSSCATPASTRSASASSTPTPTPTTSGLWRSTCDASWASRCASRPRSRPRSASTPA